MYICTTESLCCTEEINTPCKSTILQFKKYIYIYIYMKLGNEITMVHYTVLSTSVYVWNFSLITYFQCLQWCMFLSLAKRKRRNSRSFPFWGSCFRASQKLSLPLQPGFWILGVHKPRWHPANPERGHGGWVEVFPAWISSSDNELSRKSQQGQERGRVRRSQLGGFAIRGCSKELGVSLDRLVEKGSEKEGLLGLGDIWLLLRMNKPSKAETGKMAKLGISVGWREAQWPWG